MDSSQINYHQNVPMVFRSGPLLRFLLFFLTSTFGIASNRVGFRTTSLFSLGEVLPKKKKNLYFCKLEQTINGLKFKVIYDVIVFYIYVLNQLGISFPFRAFHELRLLTLNWGLPWLLRLLDPPEPKLFGPWSVPGPIEAGSPGV